MDQLCPSSGRRRSPAAIDPRHPASHQLRVHIGPTDIYPPLNPPVAVNGHFHDPSPESRMSTSGRLPPAAAQHDRSWSSAGGSAIHNPKAPSDGASHQCLRHEIQRESSGGLNRCHEREEYTEDNRRFRVDRASFVPGPTHVNGGDRNPRMPHGPELRSNCDGQLRNQIELHTPLLNPASVCALR